jgi:hypothetical protein
MINDGMNGRRNSTKPLLRLDYCQPKSETGKHAVPSVHAPCESMRAQIIEDLRYGLVSDRPTLNHAIVEEILTRVPVLKPECDDYLAISGDVARSVLMANAASAVPGTLKGCLHGVVFRMEVAVMTV